MKDFSVIWLLALGALAARVLTGCGPMTLGNPDHPYYIQSYNMDGTKLIVNGLANQQEPSTFNQDQYTIKTGQRLLMRFEALSGHVTDIKNSWDNELHMRLVPTQTTDAETLKKSVKLCPVTKNWMMFATWYKAHPFNKEGNWKSPGADFDMSSCISGEVQLPDGTNPDATPSPSPSASPGTVAFGQPVKVTQPTPTPSPSWWSDRKKSKNTPSDTPTDNGYIDKPSVVFDIKNWFLSNPEGRDSNYGFILISEKPVDVFGDHSSAYSPRIYWKQPKTTYAGCTSTTPNPEQWHCPTP